ncbi:MAG: aminopeptidase P family protein [Candidatus Heimdallarchaeota archaeon]|nr:aminopeptidase P family protein [Candidatus Heimdallarchaeota archaeon]MCK4876662.1 aminopeptidase P family protein [Candidatus Heimdallarchaeota archaeon]
MKLLNFSKREKKLKKDIEDNDIDLFIIPPSVDFLYMFKGAFHISERLVCGIIQKDDDSILIAPSFEKERMAKYTTFDDVVTWKEEEDPYDVLKKTISYDVKKIAMEPTTPFEIYSRLKKKYPDAEFIDGGYLIRKMRSIKSNAEIERMEISGENTVKGILKTIENLEEGLTELEILERAQKEMTYLSGEPSWALVQIDENSAMPHGPPSNKKLQNNSVILIDAGTMCDHYFADITVTTVFGKASEEFLKVHDVVERANEAALLKSKEGIPAEQVDFAAREVIEKAGYGKYFTHRLGHGLGLEVHEEPYIVKGNKTPLVSGNVHTDEPGIYIPNKFGVRIEDDIHVDKIGKRLVSFNRYIWD